MIVVENLTKEFRVYKRRSAFLRQMFGAAREGRDYDLVRPLNNVSVTVPSGKVHGIIGMNGAGKSTLLKILTGVLDPTAGKLKIEGRVSALLELGTGFHGELTGCENIYVNGTIMGMSRAEIDAKIEEIRRFAELGDFFDRQVKIYSSGMYVRLAFAFAVSVEPNILIIDEALSVGDAYFQQKCLKKIQQFKDSGTTILFVSHDLGAVRMLCDEVTLLSKGNVLFSGRPHQALDLYNALLAEHKHQEIVDARVATAHRTGATQSYTSGTMQMEVLSTELQNAAGAESMALVSGETAKLRIKARVNDGEIEHPTCGILIRDRLGYEIFGTNTFNLGLKTGVYQAGDEVVFEFTMPLGIGPGDYTITVALHSERSHVNDNYHWIERAVLFQVLPSTDFEFIGVTRLRPDVTIAKTSGRPA